MSKKPESSAASHYDFHSIGELPLIQQPKQTIGKHLRKVLITGLITVLPLFVTVYILNVIFNAVTKYSHPVAQNLVEYLVTLWVKPPTSAVGKAEFAELLGNITWYASPVLALIISVLIVYVLGLLGTFVVGKRILAAGEHFLENLPLIKGIYGTAKQVIQVFRQGGGGQSFQKVVLVEFPRVGTWTIGFVTKTLTDTNTQQRFICVFIPMTPNPTSGFFQMFPEDQVKDTDWTVDQGIKIILSGGMLAPSSFQFGSKSE